MKTIKFDSGVRAYRLGCGVLRFNPTDPNLYARFLEAAEKIRQVEASLAGNSRDVSALELLGNADRQLKQILTWVFGGENDFEALLGGVNLLAVAENRQRVITNLISALEPHLLEGIRSYVQESTDAAVAQAQARRAAQ